ncbi:hypothetical protein OWO77_14485 [Mammaliicoccus sciuri]|uniref:Uncharacterized protein n=1 Tax=Mammaliicoccus sciuri TaxID=1296 RepID=A0ABT7I156_MAMSC|nr:hypothetical protein [Mammaliicoccus sciuri]
MKTFKINMLLRFIHITIFLAIGYILTIQTHLFETVWIGLGFIAVVALTGIYILIKETRKIQFQISKMESIV